MIGGRLRDLGRSLARIFPGGPRCLIVTHPRLKTLYGRSIERSVRRSGMRPAFALIPEGETAKNLSAARDLYRKCLAEKLDRSSVILAFGGGVVGDTAGFVAATYLRGLPLVQVPTTLLAMVDSSIGGKTGVDLPQAKNFIGAFHQPKLVWIDPALLASLPEREIRNGLAEVIKYGVIADRDLFGILERSGPLQAAGRRALREKMIARCAAVKARVVSRDERETRGLREILNFGHTWGHAIETFTRYRAYSHGEAVALGMRAAGAMALHLGLWTRTDQDRLTGLLRRAGLPLRLKDGLPRKRMAEILSRDKKNRSGLLRFVLPRRLGKVIVRTVPASVALKGLEAIQP